MANVNLMISTFFTVLTLHCTFTNFIRGVGVGTIWKILSETNSLEEFANAFKEVVLPFGNWLLAISEGSIRFTVQAETFLPLRHCGKVTRAKLYRQICRSFLFLRK